MSLTPDEIATIKTRQSPPPPGVQVNKRLVLVIALGALLTFTWIFVSAFKPKPEHPKAEVIPLPAQPSELIAKLPKDYSQIRPAPIKLPEEKPVSKEVTLTELERMMLDEKKRKLKRKLEGRESPITFKVEIPSPSGGKNESGKKTSGLSSEILGAEILPGNPGEVKAGTIIPALLLTAINSDLTGPILAQVSENVFDTTTGRELQIPRGTKLIGSYGSGIDYGQERVMIAWNRLILPDGRSISLGNMPGIDASGAAGVADRVNNHWGKIISGVFLTSVLGAGAQMAQGTTLNQINPSFEQLATQGVAVNANTAGQRITERNLNIPPTIEIRQGMRVSVFVMKDFRL